MDLILHKPDAPCNLGRRYRHAFAHAVELLIVNAYLTEWDNELKLNPRCSHFRVIIGKDFGITRKSACFAVMKWLPRHLKANFLVADEIGGFHPKAVFWKDKNGNHFAIIGSSNLTAAAFATNYEANISCELSPGDYNVAKTWVATILEHSVPVSENWLEKYQESPRNGPSGKKSGGKVKPDALVSPLTLPTPSDMEDAIETRREQLGEYQINRDGLIELFRDCARGAISSEDFYKTLPEHWGGEVGGRLQGKGWERQGSKSNFQSLSRSFVNILDAADDGRDDVVVRELDRLARQKNPARIAFLSEMLCLRFPDLYPVLNKPVKIYLASIDFNPPSRASDGAKYLDLAQKLRVSLRQDPDHPAKNLAELDAVIWLQHHD
jgi:hypothetical protein